ncbi:MAG: hypothetical protein AB7F64_07195 [Gammaproteobacteria bacterium]
MNFLFVDQILSYEQGKGIRGVKNVTALDTYLTSGIDGKPVLSSCIVGEAIGQLCSWYIIKSTNATVRSVAGIVSEVNIYDQAYLGDTVELCVTVDDLDDQAVNWHGEAKVRGKTILVVESAVGPCLPMQDFNDPEEVKRQLHMIDRPQEMPAYIECQAFDSSAVRYYPELTQFDNILSWETGKQVVAQKKVTLIAPYFIDHFPRKPVLPLTIFLECQFNLARQFLADGFGKETLTTYLPSKVYDIKMKDFIMPGQVITTTMVLKQQTENSFTFHFKSLCEDKVVCIAKADFVRI